MTNGLDPDRMSAEERLNEVATMLAGGLLRLKAGKKVPNPSNSSTLADNSLDFGPAQSVHQGVSGDSENRHAR